MLKNDIKNHIEKLVKANGQKPGLVLYGNYLIALSNLSELIDDYMTIQDNNQHTKLTEEDYVRLRHAYDEVFASGKELKGKMHNSSADELIEDFEVVLTRDYNAIDIAPQKKAQTLADIFSISRGIKLNVDSKDLSISGANLSSRIPVSYMNESGETIKGFFTETEHLDEAKELQALYEKAVEGHPEFEKAFTFFFQDEYFMGCFGNKGGEINYIDNKLLEGKTLRTIAEDFLWQMIMPEINGLSQPEVKKIEDEHQKYIDVLQKDDTFSLRFREFAEGFGRIQNKYRIVKNDTCIPDKANVGDRNVAMSEIAATLGTPDILAHSVKMKLVVDGVEKDGTFMEFAEGSDLNNIKKGDALDSIDNNGLNNPDAFRSIADLQVLDYICGNTDRHAGNMFYKTEKTEKGIKLTGIVGIDNDCSMGTLEPQSKNGTMCLVGTDNMMVISQNYAAKITMMTDDMLKIRLKNLELSDAEIDAASKRLAHMKKVIAKGAQYFKQHPEEKIKKGYIRIVKDNEWNKYNITELGYAPGMNQNNKDENSFGNYFSTVAELPDLVKLSKEEKEEIQKREADLKKIHPQLVAEKTPFKIANAVVLKETNTAGIRHNNSKLKILHLRMNAVNKGAFISSKQFNDIIKEFKKTECLAWKVTPESNSIQMKELADSYQKLNTVVDTYIEKKKKELANNGALNNRSQRRLEFVEDLKKFVTERAEAIANEIENNSIKKNDGANKKIQKECAANSIGRSI